MTDQKGTKKKVMLAIPSVRNEINGGLVEFLCWLFREGIPGYEFDITMPRQRFPHHYARNLCVKAFLQSDYERLWFIDDDIQPTPRMLRVLEHDADIVSGMYHVLRMNKGETCYDPRPLLFRVPAQGDAPGFMFDRPDDESGMVRPVDAAGAGCLLIKRHVLEDRRMWYATEYMGLDGEMKDYMDENLPDNPKWAPPVFRHAWKPGGDELRSEDIDFCWRARKLGYSMLGDFAAHCGHLKVVDAAMVATTIASASVIGYMRALRNLGWTNDQIMEACGVTEIPNEVYEDGSLESDTPTANGNAA